MNALFNLGNALGVGQTGEWWENRFYQGTKSEESTKYLLALKADRSTLRFGVRMADRNLRLSSTETSGAQRTQKRPTKRLRAALEKAWAPETSYDPEGWSTRNPAWGQCAVTALIVQDHCGGSLVSGEVNGVPHYWNRLPTMEELDLTLNQFGGSARHSRSEVCDRDFVLSYPDTVRRYRQLQDRVLSQLASRNR